MTTLPKGIDLLKQSWQIFKQKVKILLLIQLVPLAAAVPLIIIAGAVGMINEQGQALTPEVWGSNEIAVLLVMMVIGVLGFLLQLWAQIAMILAIDNPAVGENFKALFQKARPLLLPYLGITARSFLIIFGGVLLLVIPGIIFAIWYCMSAYALVLEGKHGMEALRTSKSYVKGKTGAVVSRLAVLAVIALLLYVVPGGIFEAAHLKPVGDVFSGAVSFVFGPVSTIYLYLLFRALRDMKMGEQSVIPATEPESSGS